MWKASLLKKEMQRSRKNIVLGAISLLIVPTAYLITYLLRLCEALYFGIPLSIVTVSISDFFHYLIPSSLILIIFAGISIWFTDLFSQKHMTPVHYLNILVIFITITTVFQFAYILSLQVNNESISPLHIVVLFFPCFIRLRISYYANKFDSEEAKTLASSSNIAILGSIVLIIIYFATVTLSNNVLVFFLLLFLSIIIILEFWKKGVNASKRAKNDYFLQNVKITTARIPSLSHKKYALIAAVLTLIVFCVFAIIFSVATLNTTTNNSKLIANITDENGKKEQVCILAIYNNDYAIALRTIEVDGRLFASIPTNDSFLYFQLSNEADSIFEAPCTIEGVNYSPVNSIIELTSTSSKL